MIRDREYRPYQWPRLDPVPPVDLLKSHVQQLHQLSVPVVQLEVSQSLDARLIADTSRLSYCEPVVPDHQTLKSMSFVPGHGETVIHTTTIEQLTNPAPVEYVYDTCNGNALVEWTQVYR